MSVIRVPEFQETISDHFGKQKIRHATSVAIFWDNFNNILRQNLPEKIYGEYCEEMNIKTVVIYTPMPKYSLFGEFQFVGPNWAKGKDDKNFKK